MVEKGEGARLVVELAHEWRYELGYAVTRQRHQADDQGREYDVCEVQDYKC